MSKDAGPKFVAITGGSGAGKTWLAERLGRYFGAQAARLSLDNFYRDRSYLPEKRREQINYDHPRAIDWEALEECLQECRKGGWANVPRYDFQTHSRGSMVRFEAKPVVIIEGLWLLRKASLRALLDVRIFIECPERLRLSRRMQRDMTERGRTRESIRRQFWETVAPMHQRYIFSQRRYADLVLERPLTEEAALELGRELRRMLTMEGEESPGRADPPGARMLAGGGFNQL